MQALTAAVESSLSTTSSRGQALLQRCQGIESALSALLQHQKLQEELKVLGAAAAACEGSVREVEQLAQVRPYGREMAIIREHAPRGQWSSWWGAIRSDGSGERIRRPHLLPMSLPWSY